MASLTNSFSLTDFQRNARTYIESINKTHEPMLLTVNGKVQAVLVDPKTFQETEEQLERARLIAAIRAGEQSIQEGRTKPAEEVFADQPLLEPAVRIDTIAGIRRGLDDIKHGRMRTTEEVALDMRRKFNI